MRKLIDKMSICIYNSRRYEYTHINKLFFKRSKLQGRKEVNMEIKVSMHYVGFRSFKSKDGKTFNIVSLAEPKTNDEHNGNTVEAFVETKPAILDECKFLDKVECLLSLEDMNSKPKLITIIRRISTAEFKPV